MVRCYLHRIPYTLKKSIIWIKKIKEMLDLPEYKWEVTDIKGDYKIQDLQVLYDRIDEKKILNIDEEQIEQKKGRSR